MHFAKKMKDFMPGRSLLYLLHDHLSGYEKARSLKTIHASELTRPEGFCPRFYALADVTKIKPKEQWVSTADSITYELGRYIQDSVVHKFADMGRAVGHWKCLSCNHLHEFQKRPVKCVTCGSRVFKPEEVRFVSAVTGASCGVDMLVDVGDPLLLPTEVKSMRKEEFKDLVAPLAEHRLRTNLYLRIIAESDHPWSNMVQTGRGTVLYVCKGGYVAHPELKKWGLSDRFSPFKEYEIKRDDTKTQEQAKRARVVQDFRGGKIGMPAGICSTALVKRAQSCPLCKVCFSGDYPPAYQWSGEA